MASQRTLKLYSAWFCPFAQRAWIALNIKGVPFELVEVDPYNKSKEWLAVNPKGLVPALVHNGKSIWESSICLEYIQDAFQGVGADIFPQDAYLRAHQRMIGDHITKKLLPPFYALLQMETDSDRQLAANSLTDAFKYVESEMCENGPFIDSDKHMQYADFMLAPFALRVEPILKFYRGFELPAGMTRYQKWLLAVKNLEAVQKTNATDEQMQKIYKRYADNTAQSLVAEAVRKGTALP